MSALPEETALVEACGLFDKAWYCRNYPDVSLLGLDPVTHYLTIGFRLGRSPGPTFDGPQYLRDHTDVADSGLNPLIHYLRFGAHEGRRVSSPVVGEVADIKDLGESNTWRGMFADLDFRAPASQPRVSVIIPIYGEIEVTIRCLASLSRLEEQTTFEVILADDCSPDESPALQLIPGVRYFRNQANLGFLRTCNRAAKMSEGEFLVFLNNDTEVTPGWLDRMVELFDRSPLTGVVGSKLLYPDGRLQEAGAIYWQDAEGANYGRGDPNPQLPKYNYVREVDKVSGASLMVRRAVFSSLGGFDSLFAPAYKEDADLCFAVRSLGLRVMYQPHSVVVHHEGVSHGVDIDSGVKRHQALNRPKFVNKWEAQLSAEHFPHDRQYLSLAKERPHGRPIALVVDDKVPEYDKHAGGMGMFHYVQLLQELGFRVIFLSDNPHRREPYSTILESMGVETHHGSKWVDQMFDEYGPRIEVAWLSRPNEASKHIDRVRARSKAAVIYCGRDLHFLRIQRRAQVEEDNSLWQEAERLKRIEVELFSRADVVVTFSSLEAKQILMLEPTANVQVLAPYVMEVARPRSPRQNASHGRDVLIVGGFKHAPNADAVRWFADECWSQIADRVPDSRLVIIGSDPPEDILELASERVLVTGHVPDLASYFESARLSVAPLRYGAGVKGKIVTSMAAGCPVVTTPIGVEGMELTPGLDVMVGGGAPELVELIVQIFDDDGLHARLRHEGMRYVASRYERGVVRNALSNLLVDARVIHDGERPEPPGFDA